MKHTRIATIGALLGTVALAACTTTAGQPGESGEGADSEPLNGDTVALVLGTSGSPFYEAMACGAKTKAEELGLELDVSAAEEFSGDAQVPIINAVTASGPSVAAVVPTDAQALQQPLQELVNQGTRLITVDQTIADPSIAESAIVTDNTDGGKLAAEEVNDLIDGEGKVLVVTQPPGSSAQDQRVEGFEKQLETYDDIEYLGAQYASNDPQKVTQIISATLAAHPDLAAVFATNDQGAIGAMNGLAQADKTGTVKLVAYDAATAEVDGLKNGAIQALIAQNPEQEGQVAMDTARALIDGKETEQDIVTDLVVVRAGEDDKADEYEYKATC